MKKQKEYLKQYINHMKKMYEPRGATRKISFKTNIMNAAK